MGSLPSFAKYIILLLSSYNLCHTTLSQTVFDHKFTTDLDELLEDAKQNHDMAIYGNPLLLDKCANALLDEHKYNLDHLQWKGLPTPWFWSRESLDATIRQQPLHRRLKITHALPPDPAFVLPWSSTIANEYSYRYSSLPLHIVRWYERQGVTSPAHSAYADKYQSRADKLSELNDKEQLRSLASNVLYYHIEKAGSSSIGSGILAYYKYNNSYISENMLSHTNCGFSFVREPISRFISGYYTVNRLIYFHNLPGAFKIKYQHDRLFNWFNVIGEPQRFTQFVHDLLEFDYSFVVTSPLEHMMTQTGILSIAQNDIHFIGRLDKLKEHWHLVREFCDNGLLQEYPEKEFSRMKNYGTKAVSEHPIYAEMMGLENYEDGDVLPAYKVVADSYDLYQKLVHYYRQDFVCFGFEPDYQAFRDKVYAKWDEMMARKNATRS